MRQRRNNRGRRRLRPWVKYALGFLSVGLVVLFCVKLWPESHPDSEELREGPQSGETYNDLEVWEMLEEISLPDMTGYPRKEGKSQRIFTRDIGDYREVFNDSNYRQYEVAEQLGIFPVAGIREAYHNKRPLVHIRDNEFYQVAELTHSLPYLVPESALLLKMIGRNFIDSMGKRGIRGQKIIVTSLLRTPQSVKMLRRVNRNATDSSTHKFGTTFDIGYSRFATADSSCSASDEDCKRVLAEVLLDLRNQNRCLVKYEVKTHCFHITACGLANRKKKE